MRAFTRFIFPFFFSAAIAFSAQAESDQGFVYTDAYRECAALVTQDAAAALKRAEAALIKTEDVGMRHCRAMALYALKQYPKAAIELQQVERLIAPENIALKNYVIRQIARALNLSKQPDEALKRLQDHITALRADESDSALRTRLAAEALMERALLRESYRQYTEAVQDMDHAISLNPVNAELLTIRARIFLALKDKALARQDLAAALKVDPNNKQAKALIKKAQ